MTNIEKIIDELVKGGAAFITGLLAANAGKVLDWIRGKQKDKAEVDQITTSNYKTQVESAVAAWKMEREEKMEYRKENAELRKQLRETMDLLYNEKKKNADCERDLDYERRKNKPEDRRPDRNPA